MWGRTEKGMGGHETDELREGQKVETEGRGVDKSARVENVELEGRGEWEIVDERGEGVFSSRNVVDVGGESSIRRTSTTSGKRSGR